MRDQPSFAFHEPTPVDIVTKPDVCAKRHRGAATSIAANPSMASKRAAHEQILNLVREQGQTWLHDLCRRFNKKPNEVSPRLSELKAMKLIELTGERIEKCAVVRLANN